MLGVKKNLQKTGIGCGRALKRLDFCRAEPSAQQLPGVLSDQALPSPRSARGVPTLEQGTRRRPAPSPGIAAAFLWRHGSSAAMGRAVRPRFGFNLKPQNSDQKRSVHLVPPRRHTGARGPLRPSRGLRAQGGT